MSLEVFKKHGDMALSGMVSGDSWTVGLDGFRGFSNLYDSMKTTWAGAGWRRRDSYMLKER